MSAFTLFTTTNTILKPLLLAAVFGVVILAAFSPVFSQRVEAQVVTTFKSICALTSPVKCFEGPTAVIAVANCEAVCGALNCSPAVEGTCNIAPDAAARAVQAAPSWIGGIAMEAIIWGLIWILQYINNMLVYLVSLVARFFDATILISLAGLSGIDAIAIGWGITRDVANIFFIFILLIIAIATILRLESYGAKQLLPKLIIVALLINFSLVIATTIVDSSNVLALTFISRITPVSNKIATILRINTITDTTTITPDATNIDWKGVTSIGYLASFGILNQAFSTDTQVMSATPTGLQNKPNILVIQFFWQATILILQLTLIFVFVALGAMLLVRSVALIVIFVLAPLGFLAAILPATRGYANQWWHKLFQWSFFFPASAFMIYLAIAYGAQMSQYFQGNPVVNMGMLFNYFATVAILIGSLIVAKQMGIVGAAAAIGIGLGATRAVRGYTGRKLGGAALRYGVGPAGAAAGWPLQQIGRIPFVGAPVRLLAKPFAAMQRAGARTKEGQYEDIKKRVSESESANLATRRTLTAPGSVRSFDEAVIDKGQAHILPEQALQQHVERFKREGDLNKLRKIYAFNPNLAAVGETTDAARKAAVTRAVQGTSTDDMRTKTHAGAINNELVADAHLITSGMQKLEAAAERSGVAIGPAMEGAFDRLVAAKKIEMAAAGRVFATLVDEQTAAEEETIKHLNKENADMLKFANRNQTVNLSSTLGNKVRSITGRMNAAAEKEATDALIAREARRGGGGPSAVEIEQAKKGARKIEI